MTQFGREASIVMSRLTADSFDDPAWALVTSGESERKKRNFTEALARFTTAIENLTERTPVSAVVEALICRGVTFGQSGVPSSALADFSEAIRFNPQRGLAYYNRGYAHEQLGHYRLAVEDYSRAIELRPTDTLNYLRRGICRKRLGDRANALSDFAEVRRLTRKPSTGLKKD